MWVKLIGMMKILRLQPFETSTEQGRGLERHRRAALTAIAAAAAKFASVAMVLITIPLTIDYLGPERFGVWMMVTSFVAILSFADLGIGNGLMTTIAKASGNDDPEALSKLISSGVSVLTVIGVVLLALFILVNPIVPWPAVFNVESSLAQKEVGPAMIVFVVCIALSMPAGVVRRVQMGLQQGFVSNLWQSLGSLFALLAIILAISFSAGLHWLIAGLLGGPLLAAILNSLVYFSRSPAFLRPKFAHIQTSVVRQLVHTGFLFFILQLALAVGVSADNIIIAQIHGADAVGEYAVHAKLFAIIIVVVSMAMSPFWPAYGEALARGDHAWVKRTLVITLGSSGLLALLISGLVVVLAGPLLNIWIGGAVKPNIVLLFGFALWTVMQVMGSALAMFLNGSGIIVVQIFVALAFAGLSLVLKLVFGSSELGTSGVVWGGILAYFLTTVIPYLYYVPRVLASWK